MGTIYKILHVLPGQGPWEGNLSEASIQRERCRRSPSPCGSSPVHPGLSNSEPLWLHSEATGMATQASFRSFHHGVLSSIGQIKPLISPRTDQRQLLQEQTGSKRSRTQRFVQLVGPEPQGGSKSPLESRWGPKSSEDQHFFSFVVRCGKRTKKYIQLEPKISSGFLLLPSSTFFLAEGKLTRMFQLLQFKLHPWRKAYQDCRGYSKMPLQWVDKFHLYNLTNLDPITLHNKPFLFSYHHGN